MTKATITSDDRGRAILEGHPLYVAGLRLEIERSLLTAASSYGPRGVGDLREFFASYIDEIANLQQLPRVRAEVRNAAEEIAARILRRLVN